jgi:hypothetical protein
MEAAGHDVRLGTRSLRYRVSMTPQEPMALEDAVVGTRYRVTWNDCCVEGFFESALASKNYVPDPPAPEPFLESVTFGNGVTISSFGYALEPAGDVSSVTV